MSDFEEHPAFRAFASEPAGRAGIFCDFDGTLSPIVDDPAAARAVRGAAAALGRLAARYAVVAIVTGRAARDVAARVRAPGVRYVGLHGLEEKVGRSVRAAPEASAARAAVEAAAAQIEGSLAAMPGVHIERKGLALAVHVRRAPDPDAAERAVRPLVAAAAARHGLALFGGRRVLEVRPALPTDKGAALARIAREANLRAGLFAGDDLGDVAALEAVRTLAVSCGVAVRSAETPPGLIESADVTVEGPAAVVALLRRLADR